jgi:hypothetical protein
VAACRNLDVSRYHSLKLIISTATETRSHDVSWPWCSQLQPSILQDREIIGSWGEQISDSDLLAESAARFPLNAGVCLRSWSGADSDDGDGDGDDDSNGDGVGDGNYSTRST